MLMTMETALIIDIRKSLFIGINMLSKQTENVCLNNVIIINETNRRTVYYDFTRVYPSKIEFINQARQ